MSIPRQRHDYWRKTVRMTLLLLAVWGLVTFVPVFFARSLNRINFFGWPLAFYMAAQGALFVYLLLVGVYARRMDKLDREFNVDEQD